MELEQLLTYLIQAGWGIASFFNPKTLISYQNLLIPTAMISVLAYVAHRRGRSVAAFLFPSSIKKAKSVRMDVLYYFVIMPLAVFVLIPAVMMLQVVFTELILAKAGMFNLRAVEGENSLSAFLFYSALIFLCLDFGFYISHYFQHKWRFLWCFHKVHHSPTQLIFFTSARFHPVDIIWNVGVALFITSFVSATAQLTFYSGERYYVIFGNHALVAISYLTTHNFRHSHFWIDYPKWLRFLMSPAQHQIHHSVEMRHRDKNMGYLLTCWDKWFKTYYEPKQQEQFALGVEDVPEHGEAAHDTMWKILWLPCKEAYQLVRNR